MSAVAISAQPVVGDGVGDRAVAPQRSEVGQRGVRAVEDPQLHQLVRRDVVGELGAGELPGRPAGREAVLDHPLAERLGDDQPLVVEAAERARPAGGRRRWWPGRSGRPSSWGTRRSRRSTRPARRPPASAGRRQKSPTRPSTTRAVVVEVVAAQHGDRPGVAVAAALQAPDQPPDRARRCGAVDVGADDRVGEVEPAVRAAAVALLGDGQRHHGDGGVGEPVQHVVGLRRAVEHLADDPGDPQRRG